MLKATTIINACISFHTWNIDRYYMGAKNETMIWIQNTEKRSTRTCYGTKAPWPGPATVVPVVKLYFPCPSSDLFFLTTAARHTCLEKATKKLSIYISMLTTRGTAVVIRKATTLILVALVGNSVVVHSFSVSTAKIIS